MSQTALVFGSTGLIGRHLVELLAEDPAWDRIVTVVRRPSATPRAKVTEVLADAGSLDTVADQLAAETAFCCLGTTQKKAGGREGFRRIDHDYILKCAQIAKAQGVRRFVVVSSIGAKVGSPSFYAHVKGETERDLRALGFETLDILQPSLLLGDRSEQRWAEDLGGRVLPSLSWLFVGPLRKLRPIHAAEVARAMVAIASEKRRGVTVYAGRRLSAPSHP